LATIWQQPSPRSRAALDPDVHSNVVSITHGWRDPNVSALTAERPVDELTGMPVQTAIPVSLERRGITVE
jgi:type II secretory pathway component PulM